MKYVNFFILTIIVLCLLFPQNSPAQYNCTVNLQDPVWDAYSVRLYVHVVRYADGSGQLSGGQISTFITYLSNQFTSQNIYLSWINEDAIDIISNDDWAQGNYLSNLFLENAHVNAIDIYLGSNEISCPHPKYGFSDFNSTALWVNGSSSPQVLAHEFGHCMGLWHTFQFDHDDCVTDTPLDNNPTLNDLSNCVPDPPVPDALIRNFMSYYKYHEEINHPNDCIIHDCRSEYTPGQFWRMKASLEYAVSEGDPLGAVVSEIKYVQFKNSTVNVSDNLGGSLWWDDLETMQSVLIQLEMDSLIV